MTRQVKSSQARSGQGRSWQGRWHVIRKALLFAQFGGTAASTKGRTEECRVRLCKGKRTRGRALTAKFRVANVEVRSVHCLAGAEADVVVSALQVGVVAAVSSVKGADGAAADAELVHRALVPLPVREEKGGFVIIMLTGTSTTS